MFEMLTPVILSEFRNFCEISVKFLRYLTFDLVGEGCHATREPC